MKNRHLEIILKYFKLKLNSVIVNLRQDFQSFIGPGIELNITDRAPHYCLVMAWVKVDECLPFDNSS